MTSEPNERPNQAMEKLECEICHRTFATRQGLKMHKTRSHTVTGKKWAKGNGPLPLVEKVRPVDQRPTIVINEAAEPVTADGFLDAIEDSNYKNAVDRFLPHLAREIDRRDTNSTLVSAFMTLFIDVS